MASPPNPSSVADDDSLFRLLDQLEVFKVAGRDKRRRQILRVVGKFFPGRIVKPDILIRYLEKRILPKLLGKENDGGFVVLYLHTYVQRAENFPGVAALRLIYESLSPIVRENLEAVFFVHPGLQSRLFFATIGRFLFSAGLGFKGESYGHRWC